MHIFSLFHVGAVISAVSAGPWNAYSIVISRGCAVLSWFSQAVGSMFLSLFHVGALICNVPVGPCSAFRVAISRGCADFSFVSWALEGTVRHWSGHCVTISFGCGGMNCCTAIARYRQRKNTFRLEMPTWAGSHDLGQVNYQCKVEARSADRDEAIFGVPYIGVAIFGPPNQ